MTALLKIEWMKIRSYRTFWVMSLMFSVLLTAFYISVGLGVFSGDSGGINLFGQAQSFSKLWDDLCFYASYFVIALAILMAILTTNEYQYRTNRQNLIDGWTRLQSYHSKWSVLLTISLGTTLFVFLLGIITGLLSGVPLDTLTEHIEKLFWLFLLTVNYLGFAMTLSHFLKRSGLTIGILMFYSMIIEFFLHALFQLKFHMMAGDFFLPLQASDELVPFGPSKLLRMGIHVSYIPEPMHYAIATAAWICLYYVLGRIRLTRSDW